MQLKFETHPEVEARFPDLHPAFDARAATVEANRCLNCFDAPCMGACPTHIDVPGFIKRIASGNVTGSARTILAANVLAASCSRVCPVEVLCEGSCVMHLRGEKAIEIGRLQRFAMETYYAGGGVIPLPVRPERSEHVFCLGAGPASLACAAELRRYGVQVTVADPRPLPGGLNTYGVAEYKLRAVDSLAEIARITALGVQLVSRSIEPSELPKLEADHAAIFLGVGLGAMHRLDIPGDDPGCVVDALRFIATYKTGALVPAPRRVVVVGAGNTAIDAACAAKRLGAEEVTVVYRRGAEAISAFPFEYEHALREGVRFLWTTLPLSLEVEAGEAVLRCARTAADAGGRPQPIAGSEFSLICDCVIPAIGQSPLMEFLTHARGVTLERGRVVVDRSTGQTANPRYFAGGDCANGGREVVDAVADGKRAAHGILAALGVLGERAALAAGPLPQSSASETPLG